MHQMASKPKLPFPTGAEPPYRTGTDLAQLADQLLGTDGGIQLQDAGPSSRRLYATIRSEVHASPLIATTFWQAFIASQSFPDTLRKAGASAIAISQGEIYIVCHGEGWPRFDLVVLDPEFASESPRAVPILPNAEQLAAGWENFRYRRRLGDPSFRVFESAAIEASTAQPYGIIVSKRPKIVFTRTPSPPWQVSPIGVANPTPGPASTAGIVAKNSTGQVGVTAALHAIGSAGQASVGSISGTVVSQDAISDSCFIALQNPPIPPTGGLAGFLSGMTPRVLEKVTFNGAASSSTTTVVTGWSPDLPYVLPYSQLKVLTKADTNPGDSGAALIDSSDHIIGFSFYRTGFGAPIQYSTWIWAESVFRAHGLSVI
jgi:hypothetical protein